jgi:hypothetical protein|tara:strand:- start:156 stop:374 length:219 start_codon:yes stop_codon:yes gene_type:complete
MAHKYFEGIGFYFHSKEDFNKLLDQVKAISEEEYKEDAEDGFQDCVKYWNERSRRDFACKLKANERIINSRK